MDQIQFTNAAPAQREKTSSRLGSNIRDWLLAVGVAALMMGAWAFFFPMSFFDDFPVSGAEWVSTLGEFNEHLMRDYGAAQIGLGLAAVITAYVKSRTGAVAILSGFVLFGGLHLGYHIGTFGAFTTGSAVSQTVALTTFIVIPIGLLLAIRRDIKKGQQS